MENHTNFYLIYPLGLTELGLLELKEKWSIHFSGEALEILAVEDAGILISVKTLHGFALNHILRSPTRILMRFAEFKARDFPKLFKKISKLPWKTLMIGATPEIIVSSTNSKLFDSRKVAKAIQDGILEYYRMQPVKKKYLDHFEANKASDLPEIYYRAVDDVITISIDTTGEILHKRGEKIFTGLAPIRESLATLLLSALTHDLAPSDYTLIDPMSGSGTFLIEAHDAYKVNFDRTFSYQHTPEWIDYLLKDAFYKSFQSQKNPKFTKYLGIECLEEVIKLAKKNTQGKDISIVKGDLFSKDNEILGNNIVVINPPYGLRVGEKGTISLAYYKDIIENVRRKYAPIRIGIIIPEEYHFSAKKDEGLYRIAFKNGGLPVVFHVLNY